MPLHERSVHSGVRAPGGRQSPRAVHWSVEDSAQQSQSPVRGQRQTKHWRGEVTFACKSAPAPITNSPWAAPRIIARPIARSLDAFVALEAQVLQTVITLSTGRHAEPFVAFSSRYVTVVFVTRSRAYAQRRRTGVVIFLYSVCCEYVQ